MPCIKIITVFTTSINLFRPLSCAQNICYIYITSWYTHIITGQFWFTIFHQKLIFAERRPVGNIWKINTFHFFLQNLRWRHSHFIKTSHWCWPDYVLNKPRIKFCYQTSALPPSHHGWVCLSSFWWKKMWKYQKKVI